ncbi:Uma2 family endonuclease [Bacillus sp. DJP31]|uniref:Uma2 family endonuclease n=1 Tax=Bacillus sp. DJP31 TaxID=3409789 RepID=UPI003BB75454
MSIPQEERKYSYADYLVWDEDRIEVIDGIVINMTPAPSRKHQQVLREISTEFSLFLRDKECEVFFAPFDVRLLSEGNKDDETYNVVQPDLTVICDKEKLDEKGCKGSPDIIIEILSPASVKIDRWKKYQLYEKAGVKEYWIVDVNNESVEVYYLEDKQFEFHGVFTREDTMSVLTIKGLELNLNTIFGV